MIRSMWAAASGMQAQSMNIDVIANNIANVTTTGFKRSRAEFQDLLYETMQPPGGSTSENTQAPTGIQLGHGVRPVAVAKNFAEGELQLTKNELDLAIEGNGFFQVTLPNGTTAYTRAGAFKLDKEGRIVTPDGFLLDPEISVPSDTLTVSIGLDGTISALRAGDSAPRQLGTIQLARFTNPAGLQSMGKNLFLPTDASGTAVVGTAGERNFGTISQGFLETSNVSIVDEMVNMITAQRSYETNSKVVQASDDMLQTANNLKR
ncbi:MAG: flagellar basal-body rod protein FlgG [Hyphomicrobiales bacterium]